MDLKNIKTVSFSEIKKDKKQLINLQSLLKEKGFYRLAVDGIWGVGTERAIKDAAKELFLNTYETKLIGLSFYQRLLNYSVTPDILAVTPANSRSLTNADISKVANDLNLPIAAVKAVIDIESAGSGFLADGRIKILFEAHWFSKLTNGRFNQSHPQISSPRWNRSLYKGGSAEYPRLTLARSLDEQAALKSASYGAFQIMGFNHKVCRFDTVSAFVEANRTALGQLDAFARFLKNEGLDVHLRARNWSGFARRYNGSGYKQNQYDLKLAKAYQKYSQS